jgi:Glyoxalase-like domain
MRLRQLVALTDDLAKAEADLNAIFGWQVAFRDPVVEKWGLRNSLLPVGFDFLEVMETIRPDTSAKRHMKRMGGDCGYMVIFQVRNRRAEADRAKADGFRAVYESDEENYCLTQFHPADCGGAIFSFDQVLHPDGDPEVADSFWGAAGGDGWRDHVCVDRVTGFDAAILRANDPAATAARLANLIGTEVVAGTNRLAGAPIEVEPADGRTPGLATIRLACRDVDAIRTGARNCGRLTDNGDVAFGDLTFRLKDTA